jgi:hypothetical protein
MEASTKVIDEAVLFLLLDEEPYLTIEVPLSTFFEQRRKAMGVGFSGSTRQIIHKKRWKHIALFLFIEPAAKQLYLALGLRRDPHYHTTRAKFKEMKSEIRKFYGNETCITILRRGGKSFPPTRDGN